MSRSCFPCAAGAMALAMGLGFTAPAVAAEPSIALILGVKGSPFDDALACGALDAAKKLGLTVALFAPDHFTAESQAPVIDAVTARQPTITIISPADSHGVTRPLKQMADRGTKLITGGYHHQRSVLRGQPGRNLQCRGGPDGRRSHDRGGWRQGPGDGDHQPARLGRAGRAREGVRGGAQEGAGITYLGAQYQNDDPQKAAEIVTSSLSAHPDLAGIFSTNDQGAIGAITGLRQAGAIGKVKLVAYDLQPPRLRP